jgi:hypothetical protein
MSAKAEEMHAVLMQAKGVRWATVRPIRRS